MLALEKYNNDEQIKSEETLTPGGITSIQWPPYDDV
jgi:hypothetical protein